MYVCILGSPPTSSKKKLSSSQYHENDTFHRSVQTASSPSGWSRERGNPAKRAKVKNNSLQSCRAQTRLTVGLLAVYDLYGARLRPVRKGSFKAQATIMDKSLGTLLHFWGIFQFTQAQPFPSPHKQCWMRLSRISSEFQLYIGQGERDLQENYEKDALFYEGTCRITEKYEYCITVPRTFVHDCQNHGFWRKKSVVSISSTPFRHFGHKQVITCNNNDL